MAMLVKYVKETGLIRGAFMSDKVSLLERQQQADADTYGYLLLNTELEVDTLDHYEIRGGELRPKTQLLLTASANPWPADGTTETTITVSPFVAVTLEVEGQKVELTSAEDPLVLTVDVPQTLLIRLKPMRGYWAEPLTLHAE